MASDNLFFDTWKHYASEWQTVQNDWFKPLNDYWQLGAAKSYLDDFGSPEWVEETRLSWDECQRQYGDWLKAIQKWFPESSPFDAESFDFANADTESKMAFYFDSLKKMLDPSVFMQSGANELNQVFHRLVNIPEFADIGAYERRFMNLSSDWMALRKAGAAYQSVLAGAWSEAYELYSSEFSDYAESYSAQNPATDKVKPDQYQGLRNSIDAWLKIANKQLLATQRSPEYLQAQRELVNAATTFKFKTRELVEEWSETFDVPTRSEIDDLHRTVHQLKKELRVLKNQNSTLTKIIDEIQTRPPTELKAAKATAPDQIAISKAPSAKKTAKKKTSSAKKTVSKKRASKVSSSKATSNSGKKTSKKVGKKNSSAKQSNAIEIKPNNKPSAKLT